MKGFFKKLLSEIKLRIPAVIACILLFCTFGLYYLGLFEVSFIRRPKSWESNGEMLSAFFTRDESKNNSLDTPQSTPWQNDNDGNGNSEDTGSVGDIPPFDNGNANTDTSDKISVFTVMPKKSELISEGFRSTDAVFADGFRFALIEAPVSLPEKYSFTTKTYEKDFVITYDDGRAAELEAKEITEDRKAIELYMGYIIYDDRGTRYLLSPDGVALTKFDDTKYTPAYTRDKEGRPLFYTTYEYEIEYPTETTPPDENGNSTWVNKKKVKLEGKKYYYLAANGKTFIESDYNDAADNRGLYFDYPAYYGVPEKNTDTKENLTRYYRETTKVITPLDKKKNTFIFPSLEWLFYKKDDKAFDPKAETTVYPYSKAYNYSEGYSVVMGDVLWSYTDDEDKTKITEVTDTELFVIDETGKKMFESRKNFISDLKWTANEYYTEPLLRDISSIGSYYFDHGLLRIRLVSYDRYQFMEYDMTMIGTDDDILVYPDGSRFYIPAGYTMISYSDGMLLLERDGKYGYMNYEGKWIAQPEYKNASPFVEGVAAVQLKNGKWGMIDTAGNTVLPFRYSYVSNASSSLVAAFSDKTGWEIYTKMSK